MFSGAIGLLYDDKYSIVLYICSCEHKFTHPTSHSASHIRFSFPRVFHQVQFYPYMMLGSSRLPSVAD